MNDINMMIGLGGPNMMPLAWLIYLVFITLFVIGILYLWNYLTKKDD